MIIHQQNPFLVPSPARGRVRVGVIAIALYPRNPTLTLPLERGGN